MSPVQASSNIANVPFILSGISFAREAETVKQDAGRTIALAFGTLMSKYLVVAGAVTAGAGNTGDGTVTTLALAAAEYPPISGAWNLECITAPVAAGAVTADAGNTGDGTVTALALFGGGSPAPGTWNLECTIAPIAAGAVTAGSNTGNGTPGTATPGVAAFAGVYTLLCYDATVSGSEIFSVHDPNGVRLEDLTVAVAYANTHFGLTIADGGTDFIVGDSFTITMTGAGNGVFELNNPDGTLIVSGIATTGGAGGVTILANAFVGMTLTITDGATDFIVGDNFDLAFTGVKGGIFRLDDPNGNIIDPSIAVPWGAGATLDYTGIDAGMSFTITDGGTDFIVGDDFALAITVINLWRAFEADAIAGLQFPAGIYIGAELTAASLVAGNVENSPILVGGNCTVDSGLVVIEGGATLATILSDGQTIQEALGKLGIYTESTIAIDEFEN